MSEQLGSRRFISWWTSISRLCFLVEFARSKVDLAATQTAISHGAERGRDALFRFAARITDYRTDLMSLWKNLLPERSRKQS